MNEPLIALLKRLWAPYPTQEGRLQSHVDAVTFALNYGLTPRDDWRRN